MKRTWIVKALLLFFLLWCVYLVTFAGINFKYVQEEVWYIQIGYLVGFVLVLPAAGICIILPEQWLAIGRSADICVAAIGASMALLVTFFGNVLDWLGRRDEQSGENVSNK